MELDLRDINTMLTDAGIRDGEVMGVTGAGFVRVPAPGTEWISVCLSDEQESGWRVALYGKGEPVASELHRLRAGDWTPNDAIEIIRHHLAERGHSG
jgi:hypothetical protein